MQKGFWLQVVCIKQAYCAFGFEKPKAHSCKSKKHTILITPKSQQVMKAILFFSIFLHLSWFSPDLLAVPAVPMKEVLRVYILEGSVINEDTNEPIANANVVIKNAEDNEVINVKSNDKGKFEIILQANKIYLLRASHKSFLTTDEIALHTLQYRKIYTIQLPLKAIHLSKALLVEKINFHVNDTSFTKATYPALEKFYEILKDNEHLIVEIAVHTDSRGSDAYNLQLSQQRAAYIVNYLIKQGIGASRLRAVGYGETNLVNNCANGVLCGGTDHETNRRVEFVVIDFIE
jgi:peptidoglycan-associated lipoprotein